MSRALALLALVGLMAAVAAVGFNTPGPLLDADRNRGERHEQVSIAAIAGLPTFAGQALAIDARAIERAISEEYAAAHGRLAALPAFAGQAAAIVPDPTLTPGAVRTTNIGEVCSTSTHELRHWDRARDDHVMAEYGLPGGPHPQYEVDHLIPLGSRRRGRGRESLARTTAFNRAGLERGTEGRARGWDVLAGVLWGARRGRGPAGDRRGLDGGVWKILPSPAKPRRRGDQSRSALGPTATGTNRARPGCQNATRATSGSSRR